MVMLGNGPANGDETVKEINTDARTVKFTAEVSQFNGGPKKSVVVVVDFTSATDERVLDLACSPLWINTQGKLRRSDRWDALKDGDVISIDASASPRVTDPLGKLEKLFASLSPEQREEMLNRFKS